MAPQTTEGILDLTSPSAIELKKIPLIHQGEASLAELTKSILEQRGKTHINPEDDDEYLIPIPEWTVKEILMAIAASGTSLLSLLLVVFVSINPFVTILGAVGLIIPPFSFYQEQKITDVRAMQETNLAMERELDNMKYENERLSYENDQLAKSVVKIQQTKDTLADIKALNGKSISTLETQLTQSKVVLSMMEVNYRAELVDNIFDVMISLDTDQDMLLSDEEIDIITKKVESIEGIEIDDLAFKNKIIDTGRNLDAVLGLLNGLLDDDPTTAPEEGEKIIKFLSVSKLSEW